MGYRDLRSCVQDLERTGRLVTIEESVDPVLEIAAVQRRVYAADGPAVLFTNVKGTRFPMVSNLFGTRERIRYIFRDSVEILPKVLRLGVDPSDFMRRPSLYLNWRTPWSGWCSRPKLTSGRGAPVLESTCTLAELPHLKSWPDDGGAYITLPQVYTEDPTAPGLMHSNLGMYRVQLDGNTYNGTNEVGIHYQIHRGIGIHHASAIARGEKLRVNVFVGGPPAMTIAAVMPLPEGMSELLFAGILNQRRVRMASVPRTNLLPVSADADFALCGYLEPETLKKEGPFGDHVGYYSLLHDFPVMRVERIFHRRGAIWPFTVVGRPPQEDSMLGEFIHEITGELIPETIPGVKEVHAVDDCGVHPLLLAIGSERYTPYENPRRPMELLTLSNAILGAGQLSLAKYLFIAAGEDDPTLSVRDVPRFFTHILSRVDWRCDLHFQTGTTTDTLDYTGGALNHGSKLVISAAGPVRRTLSAELSSEDAQRLAQKLEPLGVRAPAVILPGILLFQAPPWCDDGTQHDAQRLAEKICERFSDSDVWGLLKTFPLVVLTDSTARAAASIRDFLWTAFTKTDPARDLFGAGAFVENRHYGFDGPIVLDARTKTFHAPELSEPPEVARRAEEILSRHPFGK